MIGRKRENEEIDRERMKDVSWEKMKKEWMMIWWKNEKVSCLKGKRPDEGEWKSIKLVFSSTRIERIDWRPQFRSFSVWIETKVKVCKWMNWRKKKSSTRKKVREEDDWRQRERERDEITWNQEWKIPVFRNERPTNRSSLIEERKQWKRKK